MTDGLIIKFYLLMYFLKKMKSFFCFILILTFSSGCNYSRTSTTDVIKSVPIKKISFEKTKELAQRGDYSAQYDLGLFYEQGDSVIKDENLAYKWFKKAALQKYSFAQYKLSLIYYRGDFINENYVLSYAWALNAKANGIKSELNTKDIIFVDLKGRKIKADFIAVDKEVVRVRWNDRIVPLKISNLNPDSRSIVSKLEETNDISIESHISNLELKMTNSQITLGQSMAKELFRKIERGEINEDSKGHETFSQRKEYSSTYQRDKINKIKLKHFNNAKYLFDKGIPRSKASLIQEIEELRSCVKDFDPDQGKLLELELAGREYMLGVTYQKGVLVAKFIKNYGSKNLILLNQKERIELIDLVDERLKVSRKILADTILVSNKVKSKIEELRLDTPSFVFGKIDNTVNATRKHNERESMYLLSLRQLQNFLLSARYTIEDGQIFFYDDSSMNRYDQLASAHDTALDRYSSLQIFQ